MKNFAFQDQEFDGREENLDMANKSDFDEAVETEANPPPTQTEEVEDQSAGACKSAYYKQIEEMRELIEIAESFNMDPTAKKYRQLSKLPRLDGPTPPRPTRVARNNR